MARSAKIVRELISQWNHHDAKQAASLLAEDVYYWDVTQEGPFSKRSEVQEFFQMFFSGFPNLSFEIISIFESGEHVACEWRMRGTQEKELPGINAIGKSIDIAGVSICTVKEGKVTRQVDYWDGGTMSKQLGLAG